MALFMVVLDNGATREWNIPDACAKARLADVMDALAGRPRGGDLGEPKREFEIVPEGEPLTVPEPPTVPAEQPEKVPA